MDYSEEAIPERNPLYQLPVDFTGPTASDCPTLTWADEAVWKAMVARRPLLAELEG